MRHFLYSLVLLILPIIIIFGIGELIAREVPNSYKLKEAWITRNKSDVQILICGPSHSYYCINPYYFEGYKAFNLANVSETYDYTYYLLSRDSSAYEKLKYVFLTVSYYTFPFKKLEEGPEWYRCINYKLYNECTKHSDFSKYNFELSNRETYIRKIIKFFKSDNSVGCDSLGWANDYCLATRKKTDSFYNKDVALADMKYHTSKDWSDELYIFEYLCKIAEFCQKRNIKMILVTPPVWHTYSDNCDKKQLERMYQLVDSLVHKYPVEYKDYFNDKRFELNDFYDICHLSDLGAEKFSKILKKDFLEKE